MPVIDVEPESICDGADYATVVAQANEWVDKVQSALGVPVLVYINTNLLLNLPAGIHGAGYWIADYRYGNVPGENGKTESWIGFQYGDNGQFAGESATDVDAFRPEVIIPAWSYGATPTPAPAPQPTPAPAPAPAPVGDPAVKAYQDKLNRLGFNCGAADGLNGPHTQGAVVQMEQVLGLSVDEGIWGGECESAYEQITSKPYLQEGANGLAVRYLQFRSGAGIDGIWGQETSGCIRNMQSSIGCYPDGIVGDDTWNHLIG
jgi:lysozyme